MGLWDWLLLFVVPAMGTIVAYMHSPRYKALVLCFPIPFTLATLSLGGAVDATHVLGLILLMGFWVMIYSLHHALRMPIVPSIVLSGLAYCAAGAGLVRVVPRTESVFWLAFALEFLVAILLWISIPHRPERSHRSPLPVWLKFLVLFLLTLGLIAMKSALQGFMTVFPMVGALSAYESRHSLWTTSRQIPVIMIAFAGLMAAIHVLSPRYGVACGIAVGWVAMGATLAILLRIHWGREEAPGPGPHRPASAA